MYCYHSSCPCQPDGGTVAYEELPDEVIGKVIGGKAPTTI